MLLHANMGGLNGKMDCENEGKIRETMFEEDNRLIVSISTGIVTII